MFVTHELWRDLQAGGYGHGSEGKGGGWPGLRQVVLLRISRHYLKEEDQPAEIEDHFYLTSLAPNSSSGKPASLLKLIRGHWDIENRLHHVKDRSMAEDANRTHGPASAMCRLRSIAVTLQSYLPGNWAPQKAIAANANPRRILRLLRAKCLERCKRHL